MVTGLNVNDVAAFTFDAFDNLYVYTIPTSSNIQSSAYGSYGQSYIHSRVIPVKNQIISPMAPKASNPALVCPFVDFSSNLPTDMYLDIDQQMEFSVKLDPKAGYENLIAFGISNISLINFQKTSDVQSLPSATSSVLGRTQSFVISTWNKTTPGVTDIRFAAGGQNLACDQQSKQSVVRAQCPPGRVLGLVIPRNGVVDHDKLDYFIPQLGRKRCSSGSSSALLRDSSGGYSMVLPANTYKNNDGTVGTADKIISYDCDTYGPPVKVYYSDPWTPYLGLFQVGNNGSTSKSTDDISSSPSTTPQVQFLKLVDAEFTVFEVNLRTSFSFNITQKDVGCIYAAQTWESFANPVTPSSFDLWTSSTYKDCNDSSNGHAVPSKPYSIMSLNGGVGIRWKLSVDGIYLFRVRVLDPHFSFCDLTTSFGVEVYGAPINEAIQAYVVLSSIAVMFLALGASYFWYRQSRRKEVFLNFQSIPDAANMNPRPSRSATSKVAEGGMKGGPKKRSGIIKTANFEE